MPTGKSSKITQEETSAPTGRHAKFETPAARLEANGLRREAKPPRREATRPIEANHNDAGGPASWVAPPVRGLVASRGRMTCPIPRETRRAAREAPSSSCRMTGGASGRRRFAR